MNVGRLGIWGIPEEAEEEDEDGLNAAGEDIDKGSPGR